MLVPIWGQFKESWLRERSGNQREETFSFIQFRDKYFATKEAYTKSLFPLPSALVFKHPTIFITKYAPTSSSKTWRQLWLCFGLGHLLKQEGFSWGILYLKYTRTCVLQFQKIILSMKRIQCGNLKPVEALAAPPFKSSRFCASCSWDFTATC